MRKGGIAYPVSPVNHSPVSQSRELVGGIWPNQITHKSLTQRCSMKSNMYRFPNREWRVATDRKVNHIVTKLPLLGPRAWASAIICSFTICFKCRFHEQKHHPNEANLLIVSTVLEINVHVKSSHSLVYSHTHTSHNIPAIMHSVAVEVEMGYQTHAASLWMRTCVSCMCDFSGLDSLERLV